MLFSYKTLAITTTVVIANEFNQNQFDLTWFPDSLGLSQGKLTS